MKLSNQNSLNHHLISQHNEYIYICSKCNKQFLSKERLKSHQITHASMKPYKCQVCGRGFKVRNAFYFIIIFFKTENSIWIILIDFEFLKLSLFFFSFCFY